MVHRLFFVNTGREETLRLTWIQKKKRLIRQWLQLEENSIVYNLPVLLKQPFQAVSWDEGLQPGLYEMRARKNIVKDWGKSGQWDRSLFSPPCRRHPFFLFFFSFHLSWQINHGCARGIGWQVVFKVPFFTETQYALEI